MKNNEMQNNTVNPDLETIILRRRTIRKFQSRPVAPAILTKLVDLARYHASGNNLQPVRYAIISQEPFKSQVFSHLRWAGYLPEFQISPDEQPTAYIIAITDTTVRPSCQFDIGAAATTIMLAATSCGLGSCCLGSFSRDAVTSMLNLPPELKPELVIALGYPAHESVAVPCSDSIKYTQDAAGNFYVPKRKMEDVLIYSDTP